MFDNDMAKIAFFFSIINQLNAYIYTKCHSYSMSDNSRKLKKNKQSHKRFVCMISVLASAEKM